jgi:hypothetical protein
MLRYVKVAMKKGRQPTTAPCLFLSHVAAE